MIKIRYSDLQPGLHASAATEGRHTVVYLVPGLCARDRQSAIDRLRASAKVDHGPKLPAVPLAAALMTDRVRVNVRNAVAAARLHPTGVAIPAAVLTAGAVLYALLVTVSIRMGLPATSALSLSPLPIASAPASAGHAGSAGHPGRPGGTYQVAMGGHGADPAQASRLTGNRVSSPPQAAWPAPPGSRPNPSAGPTPGLEPGGSLPPPPGPPPTVKPSPPPTGSSPPAPRSPRPSPTKTKSGGGGCLDVPLIQVCL